MWNGYGCAAHGKGTLPLSNACLSAQWCKLLLTPNLCLSVLTEPWIFTGVLSWWQRHACLHLTGCVLAESFLWWRVCTECRKMCPAHCCLCLVQANCSTTLANSMGGVGSFSLIFSKYALFFGLLPSNKIVFQVFIRIYAFFLSLNTWHLRWADYFCTRWNLVGGTRNQVYYKKRT